MTEQETREQHRKALEEEIARERTIETIPTPAGYFRAGEKLMQEQAAAREEEIAREQDPLRCTQCDGSGLLDPDGARVRFCGCPLGRSRRLTASWQAESAAPVIRHPGKTHEEILAFLADYEGTLGLGTDEKDAIRWARGRIADLTGDVQRYVSLLEKRDADYRLLLERYTAFVQQIQAIVDYHQQSKGAT